MATADNPIPPLQKRALFFVFDGGTGVGHLRRLSCIARRLQGNFACLIVTGHRAEAHWFVPAECEYVRLPSWDSLLSDRAMYWKRKPFIFLEKPQAIQLRKTIIRSIVEAFEPNVIFIDHLPLGAHDELTHILENTHCLKYLVSRGVLNETQNGRQLVLEGKALDALKLHYDRLFIAIDKKVFDFEKEYSIPADLKRKTIQTGYVVDKIQRRTINETRRHRGVKQNDTWVVASAGGGQLGEPLIEECIKLARTHSDLLFDIVCGPRSNSLFLTNRTLHLADNLILHKETPRMPDLHASADLVISSGGYNSILEALQGRARILCFPSWKSKADEQYRHAARLKNFVDIDVSTDLTQLPKLFNNARNSIKRNAVVDRRDELSFDGASTIERIVLEDMELAIG